MAIDVVMPQMGESIAEGTITRWLKKVGETVERDEPLLEISTDKVDAEIPAPAAGTVAEILANEGDTVAVNSVVARLATDGEEPESESVQKGEEAPAPVESTSHEPEPEPAAAEPSSAQGIEESPSPTSATQPLDERRRTRSSPLVRKIASENDVDLSRVEGTGMSGRVTKEDILAHIDRSRAASPIPSSTAPSTTREKPSVPLFSHSDDVRVEPLSLMRRKIADHMVISRRTSAHVTTVFEVDFGEVDRLRREHRASYAERGVKLTYMPFIASAVMNAIREFPILNASTDGDSVFYKNDINLGIAVALEWGLIVPVIRRADEKNLAGLARAITDLGERARSKKLNPDEVQGGTFTITNPGMFGGLFGTPIINQPQVAILGIGGIRKRPVVIESDQGDSIAIRPMCYLALSFDHRLIDGAVADQFMAKIRSIIESGQFTI